MGQGASGSLVFSAPTVGGTYEFRYVLRSSSTEVRTSAPFTVVPTVSDEHSLATDANSYRPWGLVTVHWTAPGHHSDLDAIELYNVGTSSYIAWQYVGQGASGSRTFAAPTSAGTYVFRYVLKSSSTVVRTSASFTVVPTVSDDHSLVVDANSYTAGSKITVHWAAPGHHSVNDSVELYKVGASSRISWQHVGKNISDSLDFVAPSVSGTYEFRYVLSGSSTVVKTSDPFAVF